MPKSEEEFHNLRNTLYAVTKAAISEEKQPKFQSIIEVARSEAVILTAIHKLKGNKGSETPGVDGQTIRMNVLQKDFKEVLEQVQKSFDNYQPKMVRRVHIPKDNGETRPLGIPAIADRIVQECVRSVIEPICEAHFFEHSYGFRPWRSTENALARLGFLAHKTGHHWVVEGDISKFFDNVNHNKLLKILWGFGVADKRVLMMIRAMLKAGVMEEITKNELGTPQGGIISPLLANVYLTPFDNFVTREYEKKVLRKNYSSSQRSLVLRGLSGKPRLKLKTAYLVRYADDWVVLTNTKENAEKLVYRYEKYLREELKLQLSLEKTKITDIRTTPISFLGYKYKLVRGNAEKGYITRSKPNEEKLAKKVAQLLKDIKLLKKCKDIETLISDINIINSKVRGLVNYYQVTTWGSEIFKQYNYRVRWAAYRAIRRRLGAKSARGKNKVVDWVPAHKCTNLTELHAKYNTALPAVKYKDHIIGVTDLAFIKRVDPALFNQEETPFTPRGRELHLKRTRKKPRLYRLDWIFGADAMATKRLLGNRNKSKCRRKLYNFEFFLNRAYAFNRDKGKCRICGEDIAPYEIETHHENPELPAEQVNRVTNLVSLHHKCHNHLHNVTLDESQLLNLGYKQKQIKKILSFREKLVN
nr:group II intron reverse transcriptase/maturase [Bacillus sp. FJAT-42315]